MIFIALIGFIIWKMGRIINWVTVKKAQDVDRNTPAFEKKMLKKDM